MKKCAEEKFAEKLKRKKEKELQEKSKKRKAHQGPVQMKQLTRGSTTACDKERRYEK